MEMDAEHRMRERMEDLGGGDARLVRLLTISVGRVLISRCDKEQSRAQAVWGDSVLSGIAEEIGHIRDWLRAAIANEARWLVNVGADGNPKKIMKCRTMDALMREADKEMRRRSSRTSLVDLGVDDEAIEMTLLDGWYVVRMLTPAALDRESADMGHCIGNGGYDEELSNPDAAFYSLRDPGGRPHVTLQTDRSKLEQMSGKKNGHPKDEYVRRLLPFLRDFEIDVNTFGSAGFIRDRAGHVHALGALPDILDIEGSLVIRQRPDGSVVLPRVLTVDGNLFLDGSFDRLPEELVVGYHLTMERPWPTVPRTLRCRHLHSGAGYPVQAFNMTTRDPAPTLSWPIRAAKRTRSALAYAAGRLSSKAPLRILAKLKGFVQPAA